MVVAAPKVPDEVPNPWPAGVAPKDELRLVVVDPNVGLGAPNAEVAFWVVPNPLEVLPKAPVVVPNPVVEGAEPKPEVD